MKKLALLLSLTFLSSSAFGLDFSCITNCFVEKKELSRDEQVIEAIKHADVKQVVKLVNAENTSKEELAKYIETANGHFGLSPQAKLKAKLIGYAKAILGALAAYKALDYYNKECLKYKKPFRDEGILDQLYNRYFYSGPIGASGKKTNNPYHNAALDIGALGLFVSAYSGVCTAFDMIKPKCDFVKHLAIRYYLENLATKIQ